MEEELLSEMSKEELVRMIMKERREYTTRLRELVRLRAWVADRLMSLYNGLRSNKHVTDDVPNLDPFRET